MKTNILPFESLTFSEVYVSEFVSGPVLTGEVLEQTLDRGVRGPNKIDGFHGWHGLPSLLNSLNN